MVTEQVFSVLCTPSFDLPLNTACIALFSVNQNKIIWYYVDFLFSTSLTGFMTRCPSLAGSFPWAAARMVVATIITHIL